MNLCADCGNVMTDEEMEIGDGVCSFCEKINNSLKWEKGEENAS